MNEDKIKQNLKEIKADPSLVSIFKNSLNADEREAAKRFTAICTCKPGSMYVRLGCTAKEHKP